MSRPSLLRILATHQKSAAPSEGFWKQKKEQLAGVMSTRTDGMRFVEVANLLTGGMSPILQELRILNSPVRDVRLDTILDRLQRGMEWVSNSLAEYQLLLLTPLGLPGPAGKVVNVVQMEMAKYIGDQLGTLQDCWDKRFELGHLRDWLKKDFFSAVQSLDPTLLGRITNANVPKIVAEVFKIPNDQWDGLKTLDDFKKDHPFRKNPWGDPIQQLDKIRKEWPEDPVIFPFSSMTDKEVASLLDESGWTSESYIAASEGYDGPMKGMDKAIAAYVAEDVKKETIRLRALPLEKQRAKVLELQRARTPGLDKILSRIKYTP